MNTEHEFCFTIKLKQNNIRDLKDVLHAQETFCRYFRHTKRTHKKNNSNKKKNLPKQKTKNTQQQKQNTKRPKSKIKRNNKILKKKIKEIKKLISKDMYKII